MRDFSASLYQIKLKHSEDINEEAYLTEEIDKSKKNTENLQSDLKLSSDKYTYFQELRNYIIDLAEFLDEKVKYYFIIIIISLYHYIIIIIVIIVIINY